MATSLALDPALLERAIAVSDQATNEAAVTLALQESRQVRVADCSIYT